MNFVRKSMAVSKGGKIADSWYTERELGLGKNCINKVWVEMDDTGIEQPYTTDMYGRIAPAVTVETLQDNCDSAMYLIERERVAMRGWADFVTMEDPSNPDAGPHGPWPTFDNKALGEPLRRPCPRKV